MQNYERLFAKNKDWATSIRKTDPDYFERRAASQEPHFFFIGCCDSRVPAELLTGSAPGEIFTHRNIANQAHPNDLCMLSALEYAVEFLDVKHVLVCGHYGCGGVKASLGPQAHGLVDHWLHVIRDVYRLNGPEIDALPDVAARTDRLVELNVLEQVRQLTRTPVVQRAWAKGRRPVLHGIVYDLHDGLLKEVVTGVDGEDKALALRNRGAGQIPAKLHVPVEGE
ncbi:MAG TPA: carbonic anhydrase [Gemmatimonadaceae bacterium]|nr:carbonic anhydrase [Gemmatimonadaceae bacterium]